MKKILLVLMLLSNLFADYATFLLHIECNDKENYLTITPVPFHVNESPVDKDDKNLHKKLGYYVGSSVCSLSPKSKIKIDTYYIDLGYTSMDNFSISLNAKNTFEDFRINPEEQIFVELQNNIVIMKKRKIIPNPGFSCSNAETKTEKYICGDSAIASQDYRMKKLYNYLQSVYDNKDQIQLQEEQRKWLNRRNNISPDFIDLYLAYSDRLSILWSLFEESQNEDEKH